MTDFTELLTTIQQVRTATLVHIKSERDPEIRAGMEINLDLLTRALENAGWPIDDLEMHDDSCGECGHPYKREDGPMHYPECSRAKRVEQAFDEAWGTATRSN